MLPRLKQKISGFMLVPSSGGRFEIELDGELIYSKLETGSFPNEAELIAEIARLVGA
ncbi:MAG: Rdx family protein [Planctomycetales bacterium]|nr:Rdx family protein [Planctomycetales bacterium]